MKITITSKERNPLLKRREVVFEVDHKDTGSTPPRLEVRKELAALLKADPECVYVKRMVTKTGLMVAVGEANAYDRVEDAKLVEPKYIVARNQPPEKPKEVESAEKVEEKPKEKPMEKLKKGKPAEEKPKGEEGREKVKEVVENPSEEKKKEEKPE